jgi:hypothetical protein
MKMLGLGPCRRARVPRLGGRFECAQTGRSDRDDAAAAGAGARDRGGGGLAESRSARRACGARDTGLDAHRLESAGADVQRQPRDFDAALVEPREQRWSKCRPAVGAATAPG